MLFKYLKNKKIALLAITSMLLLSVCLLPCRGLAMIGADSMSHHDSSTEATASHGKHLSSLRCHDAVKTSQQYDSSNKMSCPHCELYAPAAIKDTPSNVTSNLYNILGLETGTSSLLLSQKSQFDLDHPPPPLKQSIHKTHSIYII